MIGVAYKLKSFILFCIICVICCSLNLSDSGSGTNVGNAIVTGIIHDQNGNPVSNTRVLLLPFDNNPVANPIVQNKCIDTTGSHGLYVFIFDGIGKYNIEAEHIVQQTKLLIQNIDVVKNCTITVPTEMLKKTGALRVGLQDSLLNGFIYIPGTTVKQQIKYVQNRDDTVVIHSIPAGRMPSINHVHSTSINNPTPIAIDVSVTPGDTTNIDAENEFTINQILFKENFDDSDLISKGWYDDVNPVLSVNEHIENSVSSIEYTFLTGDTVPVGGTAMRHLFEETDSVYISFYIKYSKNWQGSKSYSGASGIALLTNKDTEWAGPGYNSFSVHVQQDSGKPIVYMNDAKNIDESNIDVDLTDITEYRAVAGCNGDCDGYGVGECYQGSTYHSNYKPFKKENTYFQDNPGKYYKNDWHFIEMYLKLNSISNNKGVADGIIKYWYDEELIMHYDHVMFRTAEHADMKINQIIMAPYIGTSPVDQSYWIDNLTIAR